MTNPPTVIRRSDTAATAAALRRHGLSDHDFLELRAVAASAKSSAYCPYSRFRVGAAVLTTGPEIVHGANVENASYPVGTCAERVAIGTAVVEGYRRGDFKAVAVSTDVAPPASPCGMCRQFIREFCDLDMPIIMFDKNEDFVIVKLEELLPMSFGPDQLLPPDYSGGHVEDLGGVD